MKLRTKITLISISIVVFSAIVFMSLSIYNIKRKGKQDIAIFKTEETNRIKKYLKEFTDVAYETIESNYRNSQDIDFLEKYYGKGLKDIARIAESILQKNDAMARKGLITSQEAKRRAFEALRDIRFDDGVGYIWLCSTDLPLPIVVLNPVRPELEGKPFNPKEGGTILGSNKNLMQAAVEICNENGEGFISYTWRKATPTGFIEDARKLSYVRKFDKWDIIIGTGVYIDDAIDDAKQRCITDIRKMRYADETGYFYIFTNETPFPRMIMSAVDANKEGQTLDDPSYNCALGIGKNLFVAFADVCNSEGAGYVDYLWKKPQPDGTFLANVPKMSYGKLFEPWGWITGTGLYMDSIDIKIAEKEDQIVSQIRQLTWKIVWASVIVVFLGFILSFFFAKSICEPIGELVQTIKGVDLNGLSTTKVSLKGTQEIKELGGIFNAMLVSLHDSVEMLKYTTSEKEKIESELNIARDIQMSIIPKIFPAFPERPEFDVYGKVESAKAVGGDLFDFQFIDEDNLCFTIGDVSGKGVPASLFMAVTSTLVRAKAIKGVSVSEIVSGINQALCHDNDLSMFVTLFMAIFNIRTGEMEFCNAGHNPPYIIKNQKDIVKLDDRHGMPIAIFEEQIYGSGKIKINPSDTIVLYTDGVTEADNINRELFEEKRLEAVLKDNALLSPKGITDAIFKEVHAFAGDAEQADDITILALTYRGNIR